MKLNVNGSLYVVKFYYYDTLTCAPNMASRRHTTCTIEGPGLSASGTVVCNPKEPYVKVAARRYALKKTLQDCDRPFRAGIWQAYFATILADRRRGIMERWGVDEYHLHNDGLFDDSTGGRAGAASHKSA